MCRRMGEVSDSFRVTQWVSGRGLDSLWKRLLSYLPPQCIVSGTQYSVDVCGKNWCIFTISGLPRGKKYIHTFPPYIFVECVCIDFANPAFITLPAYGTSLPNTAGSHMIQVWPIRAFRFPSHSDLFNDQHVVQAWPVTAYANSVLGICFGPALTSRGEAAWEWSQYRRKQN